MQLPGDRPSPTSARRCLVRRSSAAGQFEPYFRGKTCVPENTVGTSDAPLVVYGGQRNSRTAVCTKTPKPFQSLFAWASLAAKPQPHTRYTSVFHADSAVQWDRRIRGLTPPRPSRIGTFSTAGRQVSGTNASGPSGDCGTCSWGDHLPFCSTGDHHRWKAVGKVPRR